MAEGGGGDLTEEVLLKPANNDYDEIYVEADKVEVQGRVIAVIHSFP